MSVGLRFCCVPFHATESGRGGDCSTLGEWEWIRRAEDLMRGGLTCGWSVGRSGVVRPVVLWEPRDRLADRSWGREGGGKAVGRLSCREGPVSGLLSKASGDPSPREVDAGIKDLRVAWKSVRKELLRRALHGQKITMVQESLCAGKCPRESCLAGADLEIAWCTKRE